MSPAVMNFSSPSTSSQQSHSSLQNHSNTCNGEITCSFPSSSVPSVRNVSGRSRPRLVKLRKQQGSSQQGKSKSAQNGSGLNLFRSVSESSSRVDDAASTNTPNRGGIAGDVTFGKFDYKSDIGLKSNSRREECSGNVGKLVANVFGGNGSHSGSNLNLGKREASGISGQVGAGEFGRVDNVGFLFGVSKSSLTCDSKLENGVFAFGANRSSSPTQSNLDNGNFVCGVNTNNLAANLNSGQTESDGSMGISGTDNFVKYNSVGSVFDANKSDSAPNSNSGLSESNVSVGKSDNESGAGKLGADQFGKSENVCFVFGADKSNSGAVSNLENRNSCRSGGTLSMNGFGQFVNVDFVFGAGKSVLNAEEKDTGKKNLGIDEFRKLSNVEFAFGSKSNMAASRLNSETSHPCENVGKFGDEKGKLEEENKLEVRTLYNVDFVSDANCRNVTSNMNLGKNESLENNGKSVPELREKMKLDTGGDFGKVGYAGFECGTNSSDLRSDCKLERTGSDENVGKSVSYEDGNLRHKAQWRKFGDMGFVFGSKKSDSTSSADLEISENGRSAGKLEFFWGNNMKGDVETEFQKAIGGDVFVFSSGSKESSTFNGSNEVGDGMNKWNSENAEKCTSFVKKQNEYAGSDANVMHNFVLGSTNSLGSAISEHPVFKLSDEIKTLNINDSEKVNGTDKTRSCDNNSCAESDNKFVLGSITSWNQLKGATLEVPGKGVAVEKTEGANVKTGIKKTFPSGNNETSAGSFGGSAENILPAELRNTNTRFGVGVVREPINSGKENHPSNMDNKSLDGGPFPRPQPNDDRSLHKGPISSSLSSMGVSFWPNGSVTEVPFVAEDEVKDEFCFTSTPVGLGASFTDFSKPNLNASCSFTASLFPGLSKKLESSTNNRSVRHKKWKKTRGKLKQSMHVQQLAGEDYLSKQGISQQNLESPGCGSPMDFAPYEDTNNIPSPANLTDFAETKDADLAAAGEQSDINEGDKKYSEPNNKASGDYFKNYFVADRSVETFACGAEAEQVYSATERDSIDSPAGVASAEADFFSKTQRENSGCTAPFCFVSNIESSGGKKPPFSASSSAQDGLSAIRRQYRKKYKLKVGCGSDRSSPSPKVDFASSSVQFSPLAGNSLHLDSLQVQNEVTLNSQSIGNHIFKAGEDVKQGFREASIKKACELWRVRGNQAYKKGDLFKAEEFYTKGIDVIPHTKQSGCCIEPLVLCYSNRAATRMYLGQTREALRDCTIAAALDPSFLKVKIRAANCHLLLGEVGHAVQYFSKCLESGSDVCLDRRITIEAADGIQKAQVPHYLYFKF
ncbi:unnamed protein product [Ilex paraguariensis]|uniref:Uncharacterized protein n=1 Tax=Ilex paraguariensis TaxID=185542 RepID=A0ABC8URX8_9AQUA